MTSAAIGVAVGAAVAAVGSWQLAMLVGWDVASASLVARIFRSIGTLDAAATRRLATQEDDSRASSRLVVIVACVTSIGGVVVGLVKARALGGAGGAVLTIAAVLAVALAWLSVHSIFTLKYAHRFYDAGGGIDFPGGAEPSFRDFAYVAFTVGMTFQVSDTEIPDAGLRWLLLRHAALSYLFGTVIVGLAINVIGGLLG